MIRSGFKGKFVSFVPISEVPWLAAAEDADQARQDAL